MQLNEVEFYIPLQKGTSSECQKLRFSGRAITYRGRGIGPCPLGQKKNNIFGDRKNMKTRFLLRESISGQTRNYPYRLLYEILNTSLHIIIICDELESKLFKLREIKIINDKVGDLSVFDCWCLTGSSDPDSDSDRIHSVPIPFNIYNYYSSRTFCIMKHYSSFNTIYFCKSVCGHT